MKLAEAIERVRLEKPNGYDAQQLTQYVNELEEIIREYISDNSYRKPLNYGEDGGDELLVQPPYDVMYISYLKAKIDYCNEEYESYTNNQAQFETDLANWKKYMMRNGLIPKELPHKFKNWW